MFRIDRDQVQTGRFEVETGAGESLGNHDLFPTIVDLLQDMCASARRARPPAHARLGTFDTCGTALGRVRSAARAAELRSREPAASAAIPYATRVPRGSLTIGARAYLRPGTTPAGTTRPSTRSGGRSTARTRPTTPSYTGRRLSPRIWSGCTSHRTWTSTTAARSRRLAGSTAGSRAHLVRTTSPRPRTPSSRTTRRARRRRRARTRRAARRARARRRRTGRPRRACRFRRSRYWAKRACQWVALQSRRRADEPRSAYRSAGGNARKKWAS